MESPLTLLIAAILTIAVWLILRPIVLWYFKVNQIEELLQEQVKILRLVHKDKLSEIEPENKIEGSYIEGVVFSLPENLEFKEREFIEAKASKLQKGQLLAFDTFTRRTDFFEIEEYNKFIKTANRPTLIIVAIKQ